MTGSSGAGAGRLQALVGQQRRELDRLRSRAAARSVTDLATGMLMEQLGCTPAEARHQLASLAREAGHSVEALAAQITGQPNPGGDPDAAAAVDLDWTGIPNAPDGTALAATLLDEALTAVGAVAVALWVTEPDGGLELAGQAGLGELVASRWRRIHPGMRTLAQEAAAGAEIWRLSGQPAVGDSQQRIGRWQDGARALLPLNRRGVPAGCMVIFWPEPLEEFPPALRKQLAALADLAAQALDMDGPGTGQGSRHRAFWIFGLLEALLERFWFARPVKAADGSVTDFRIVHAGGQFRGAGRCDSELAGRRLAEACPQAGLPGGLLHACVTAQATGQPQHLSEDLTAAQPEGDVPAHPAVVIAPLYDGVAIAWRAAGDEGRLATLLQHAQRLGRIGGWEENLRTGEVHWDEYTFALFGREPGQPVPVAELHSAVLPDDIPAVDGFRDALLGERRQSAAAFRVVRADDRSVRQMRAYAEAVTDAAGALTAIRGAYQDISADYHTRLAFAAAREQLADTEQRAQDEHRLAMRLQQAITPRSSEPVAAAGLDVVARYRPSGPAALVSGDWYDTVLLPTKEVLVVVGDIAGHGLDAVTGMVAMRNALRGLAITGAGPAALLGWLNSAACHLTDGIIGTAMCGVYDPTARTLRWARAGHLPPVLVRRGKARALDLPHGLLFGADPEGSYAEVTTSLRLGDVLLLFTDGLIERRDQPIDDALGSLLRIASRPVSDVSSYADEVVAETSANTDDDACLVAIHVR